MTTDEGEAKKTADRLDELNALRQREEKRVFDDIVDFLNKNQTIMDSKCLVLAGTGWHEGILGIVASRITQRYGKPAVVIAIDNEIGKGSGRSVNGFNLFEAISACSDLVLQFGGHAMAAGLQIEKANIELFRKRLVKVCIDRTGPNDFIPEMRIDYELDLDTVSPDLADEIEQFKPFGTRNPEPLFLARNVRVLSSSPVGGFHRRMMLAPAQGNASLPAIQFYAGPPAAERTFFSQLVYKLQWNRWNGNKKLQLIVEDID
jgi:single-stranded-DNA-specific exonuclease